MVLCLENILQMTSTPIPSARRMSLETLRYIVIFGFYANLLILVIHRLCYVTQVGEDCMEITRQILMMVTAVREPLPCGGPAESRHNLGATSVERHTRTD